MLKKVTCQNFEKEILHSPKTVYLLFSADWCRDCRRFSVYFKQISFKFQKNIKFCILDVDREPELTEQFGILDVPSVVVIKQGKIAGRYSERIFRSRMDAFFKKQQTENGEEKPCAATRKQA